MKIPKDILILNSPAHWPKEYLAPVLILGNLDGVHRGHQELIHRAQGLLSKKTLAVLTLDPHPAKILSSIGFQRIFSIEQQQHLLAKLGVEVVYYVNFDSRIAESSPEQFLQMVEKWIQPQGLVVGFNFRFGKNRSGGEAEIKRFFGKIPVEVVSPVLSQGEPVSSSAIRKGLELGDLRKVSQLLGFDFFVWGRVEAGDQRGRSMGFPTANILAPATLMPQPGVYVTTIRLIESSQILKSITNWGGAPTFENQDMKLETYVFDFSGDLYGQQIEVRFTEKIRDIRKFSGAEELRQQIERDVAKATAIHQHSGRTHSL